ncbi:hypothetical protein HBA_0111 [Sodalis endosymbiont of Henestaris halophilus]|nr:hypothetical protein HBA_0111 [Sodalis endosymbiont of Henestaris halophilus]
MSRGINQTVVLVCTVIIYSLTEILYNLHLPSSYDQTKLPQSLLSCLVVLKDFALIANPLYRRRIATMMLNGVCTAVV